MALRDIQSDSKLEDNGQARKELFDICYAWLYKNINRFFSPSDFFRKKVSEQNNETETGGREETVPCEARSKRLLSSAGLVRGRFHDAPFGKSGEDMYADDRANRALEA